MQPQLLSTSLVMIYVISVSRLESLKLSAARASTMHLISSVVCLTKLKRWLSCQQTFVNISNSLGPIPVIQVPTKFIIRVTRPIFAKRGILTPRLHCIFSCGRSKVKMNQRIFYSTWLNRPKILSTSDPEESYIVDDNPSHLKNSWQPTNRKSWHLL